MKSSPYEPYENNQVKFLIRKGKRKSVHDNDELRIAGLPERRPERAKVGDIVRSLFHPEDSHSPYWMQGKLEKRIDKYGTARESGFTRNRFTVRNLAIINSWDIDGTIPEVISFSIFNFDNHEYFRE